MENLKQRLTEIRNKLYDSMPTGQINAFELTIVIANHLKELDNFIDNECEGNNQPDTDSKCNKHIVNGCALQLNDKLVDNMCMSYRHDFGLMNQLQQDHLRFQCKEWLRAYENNIEHCR